MIEDDNWLSEGIDEITAEGYAMQNAQDLISKMNNEQLSLSMKQPFTNERIHGLQFYEWQDMLLEEQKKRGK